MQFSLKPFMCSEKCLISIYLITFLCVVYVLYAYIYIHCVYFICVLYVYIYMHYSQTQTCIYIYFTCLSKSPIIVYTCYELSFFVQLFLNCYVKTDMRSSLQLDKFGSCMLYSWLLSTTLQGTRKADENQQQALCAGGKSEG